MGANRDNVSGFEVHVTSACEDQREFALLLRPLYRQGVLFIPSRDALIGVDGSFHLRLALADDTTILRAIARRVDPFAHGLTTGGYPGFALELRDLDPRGQEFIAELTRSMDGTLPFGIPSGALGHERILCRVVLDVVLERTMAATAATPQPVTEVAGTLVPGTGTGTGTGAEPAEEETGVTLAGQEAEESTIVLGDDGFAAMAEEQTAIEHSEGAAASPDVHDSLENMSDSEEATAVAAGPPMGARVPGPPRPVPNARLGAVAIPLAAPTPMPVSTPIPMPSTAPVSAPSAPLRGASSSPYGSGAVAQQAYATPPPAVMNHPAYNEMPSSILLGVGESPISNRLHTSTDFISSVSNSNRPLIISTLVAVVLGLGTGYLLWGGNDAEGVVASTASDSENAADAPPTDLTTPEEPIGATAADAGASAKAVAPAIEPPPFSAPAGACLVSISTSPEGAALFYEGSFIGVSPYQGDITCEAQHVDIRHPRFQNSQATFEMVDGKASERIELERPKFFVTLKSIPAKASVKRDGEFLGKTPISIRLPGFESTSITVVRKGFAPQTVAIEPTSYKSTVNLKLQRRR